MLDRQPIGAEDGAAKVIRSPEDWLAIEGYRLTGDETLAFAEAAWQLVGELDWVWDEAGSNED